MITKNIVINPTLFPIIGENNRLVKEISKRFSKYYKRGIKSVNRNKILGYNLIIPKCFGKFEAIFREDLLMMEIKINNKSSILVPSFYTPESTISNFFELKKRNKLSNIYFFENNKKIIRINDRIRMINEVVPERSSSEVAIDQDITLGRADDIKDFTKKFLRNTYGDAGLARIWDAIISAEDTAVVGGLIKVTAGPFARILRSLTRAAQGDKVLKKDKFKDLISCENTNEMKTKTSQILLKLFNGEAKTKEEFIRAAVSIYDNPDNLTGWFNKLTSIDISEMLIEEKQIFDAITKKFNISLNFGQRGIPSTIQGGKEIASEVQEARSALFLRTGILRFFLRGHIRRALNKFFKTNKFGKKFSYSVKDYDKEIANAIKKYTEDLDPNLSSEKTTREVSEGGFGSFLKKSARFIIPTMTLYFAWVSILGIDPMTALEEHGIATGEEIFYDYTGIQSPSEAAESEKAERDALISQGYQQGQESASSETKKIKEEMKKLTERVKKAEEESKRLRKVMKSSFITLKQIEVCSFIDTKDKIEKIPQFKDMSEEGKFFAVLTANICKFSIKDGVKTDARLIESIFKFVKYGKGTLDDTGTYIANGILKYNLNIDKDINDINDQEKTRLINSLRALKSSINGDLLQLAASFQIGGQDLQSSFLELQGEIIDASQDLDKRFKEAEAKSGGDQIKSLSIVHNQEIQNDSSSTINKEAVELAKLTKDRFDSIGDDFEARWNKNIDKTNSRGVALFREIKFLPLNIFLNAMSIVEEEYSGKAEYAEAFKKWNQDKDNLTRTEALLALFWLLTITSYSFNTSSSLGTNVLQAFKEITSNTNIFKIKPIQMVIQTIQMVTWASVSEEFKAIVEEAENSENEDEADKQIKNVSNFTPEQMASFSDLIKKLNGITLKKGFLSDDEKKSGVIDLTRESDTNVQIPKLIISANFNKN